MGFPSDSPFVAQKMSLLIEQAQFKGHQKITKFTTPAILTMKIYADINNITLRYTHPSNYTQLMHFRQPFCFSI